MVRYAPIPRPSDRSDIAMLAIVPAAVLRCPHWWPSSNQATNLESQTTHGIQYVLGQTLRTTPWTDAPKSERGDLAVRPSAKRFAQCEHSPDKTP